MNWQVLSSGITYSINDAAPFSGAPRLKGALAWIDCELDAVHVELVGSVGIGDVERDVGAHLHLHDPVLATVDADDHVDLHRAVDGRLWRGDLHHGGAGAGGCGVGSGGGSGVGGGRGGGDGGG